MVDGLNCDICGNELVKEVEFEPFNYFIGDYEIEIEAEIPHRMCPSCGKFCRNPHEREIINDAFNKKLDEFWLAILRKIATKDEISTLRYVCGKVISHVGGFRQHKTCEEFGRWLGGCNFSRMD